MNSNRKIRAFFLKLVKPFVRNYVPRKYIFLIDLALAYIAAESSFFLMSTVTGESYSLFSFKWQLWVVVAIQAGYFILLKSYFGLVRYSSFKDAIKQLKVTTFCVLSVLFVNQVYFYTLGDKLIIDAGVVIYGFITFSLLFFFRVVVKQAYQVIHTTKNSSTAYFLGTDRSNIATAEGLISENSKAFNIIGFVNEHPKPIRTRIFNLPIYNIEQLEKSNTIAQSVIVSEDKLEELRESKNDVLSRLLDLKVKIYKLPRLQDWNNKTPLKSLKKINIEDLLQRTPIKLNNKKLFKLYQGKTILVTGAAGSIGSEIVRQLIAFQPEKILLLDQAETPLHELTVFLDKNFPKVRYVKIIANVRSKKRLKAIFENHNPDVVFHGAAYKHVPMMEGNPIEALSVNFRGTRNLAELSVAYDIERFVFVSTDKAVNPTNIMGASKRAAELYIQSLACDRKQHKTTFITTRFGNVLGSNGSVIPHFKKQIEENGPVTVTHPEITRYFMTIDEACQLVLEAGAMGKGGEIYVFDMGSPVKIIDLAHNMIRLTGLIPNKDIKIEFTGLRPGEKLYEELLADKETTLPTHHEKILIAQATHTFDGSKLNLLSELLKLVKEEESLAAIKTLKTLVPEYRKADNKQKKGNKKNVISIKTPSNVA